MNYLCVTKCVYTFTFAVIYCSGTVLFSPCCFLLFIYCYYVFFSNQVGYKLYQRPGPRKNNIALRPTCKEADKIRGRRRRRFYANIMCDRQRPNWARRGCYFPGNSLYQSQRTTLHSFSDLVFFTVLLFCLIL